LQDGPYAHVRVIEGVPANTTHHSQVTPDGDLWEALTLARITRPANTGVVEQSHITPLVSLVDTQRNRDQSTDEPPMAFGIWNTTLMATSEDELLPTDTNFKDWPSEASFQVPVPEWARG